jgi:hypothetical protein
MTMVKCKEVPIAGKGEGVIAEQDLHPGDQIIWKIPIFAFLFRRAFH